MKSQLITINLYKKPGNSKHKIEIQPIINKNNSSNTLDSKNDKDIFLEKMKKKNESKNNNKLSLKELTIKDQLGENSSGKKTISTSYNINYGPETFRYKNKNPSLYYKKWVNLNFSDSESYYNKSFDENNKTLINGKKIKNNNENTDVKCCSIF